MEKLRYGIFKLGDTLEFVWMPESHMYQLTALNHRLHKEIGKLTASRVPALPRIIAECDELERIDPSIPMLSGLAYINALEQAFASIEESAYPLVSLLTEIRALQAQLEQWFEEHEEEQQQRA